MFKYKILNEVQTKLLMWGNPFDCDGSDVVLCITGNPGVPDFYVEFGNKLHRDTGLPVCVVGQAGHCQVPDLQSNILVKQEHLFDLEGQLDHKLDLINNYIDKRSKIHLIGHSVGAWMVLELLHRHTPLNERVSSINLLFPTLQKLAETKNGKFLNGIMRKMHILMIFAITIAFLLPDVVQSFLIGLYLRFYSLPSHYVDRILKYVNPAVIEKVLFLAYDKMDKVKELNQDAVDIIKHKTNIIYSDRDGWAPVSYMEALEPFQPPLQLKEVPINHAFVLRYSESVAEMVSQFIKHRLIK